jgi:hypothetical protein
VQARASARHLDRAVCRRIHRASFVVRQHGRDTVAALRAIGWSGVAVALCSTAATLCFLNALR